MKLFVKYEEGDDEGAHMNTKFTVPKSWRPGPVSKLLGFAVDTYNGKHADATLDLANVHFEFDGDALGLEDIVEAVLKTKDEVLIKPGASRPLGDKAEAAADAEAAAAAEAEAKRVFAIGKITCKNFGCGELFDPNDPDANPEGSCHHHVSPPFFHDCNKGWTCCRGKTAMDWEDFQKLPTCAVGRHSATPPAAPAKKAAADEDTHFKAQKVEPKLSSIDGYNKSDEGKTAVTAASSFAKSTGTKAKPKVVKYADGTYRCQNKGCAAKFLQSENDPKACRFHAGTPVFHETLKWWGCCAHKKKMDFDAFMAVAGCCEGPHWNGEGEAPTGKDTDTTTAGVVEADAEGFDLG